MTAPKKPAKQPVEWPDDPRLGQLIDDNALYVLEMIARGMLASAGKDTFVLTARAPLEWRHKDMLAFILRVAAAYSFELTNISVMTYAFEEEYELPIVDNKGRVDPAYEKVWDAYQAKYKEYEKCREQYKLKKAEGFRECMAKFPMPPKKHTGAYKWALNCAARAETDEDKLFLRVFENKLDMQDMVRLMELSSLSLSNTEPADSDASYAKEISGSIINWLSFDVDEGKIIARQIQHDLDAYLDQFIHGKLQRGRGNRRISRAFVELCANTYTFEKHKQLLIDQFKEMRANYGDNFVFENPFDEGLHIPDEDIIRERYSTRQFLFMHSLFAFEQLGYVKMRSLGTNWTWHEDKPTRYTATVELQPAFIELIDKGQANLALHFDEAKSRLYFRGVEVKILKFSDQYHALRIIFENTDEIPKEWFFSEIAERVDVHDANDRKYYNALYQVRLKLEGKGFPDFFVMTRQSAKIDPKYLS